MAKTIKQLKKAMLKCVSFKELSMPKSELAIDLKCSITIIGERLFIIEWVSPVPIAIAGVGFRRATGCVDVIICGIVKVIIAHATIG